MDEMTCRIILSVCMFGAEGGGSAMGGLRDEIRGTMTVVAE